MKQCKVCEAKWDDARVTCPYDEGELVALPDPLIGRVVASRFVVGERIGAGGMGVVYSALDQTRGQPVAIKFLAPDLAFDATTRARFLREARAANRINHPNIIHILEAGETSDGLIYLVMELLEGESLSAMTRRKPLDKVLALRILAEMASALGRAHELEVIHRDIKPQNIFILSGEEGALGGVKLLDFGLAKVQGEIRLTRTGAVFGTPEYMSPEQARGAPIDARTDLYGCGVVLYEMLTGRVPFRGTTPELILHHIKTTPVRPSKRGVFVPKSVDELVLKLLAKDPDDRHRDAYHLLEDVHSILEKLGNSSRSSVDSSPGQGPGMVFRQMQPEDMWDRQLIVFEQMVEDKRAPVTPAVRRGLDEMRAEVKAIRALRREVRALSRESDAITHRFREAQLRIGKALDQLSIDESRLSRELAAFSKTPESPRAAQLVNALRVAWRAVPAAPAEGEPASDHDVALLVEAGRRGSEWLDHLAGEIRMRAAEQERQDLVFQVAQLKGRLGSLHAEQEHELEPLRTKSSEIDVKVESTLTRLADLGESVVRHFRNHGYSSLPAGAR